MTFCWGTVKLVMLVHYQHCTLPNSQCYITPTLSHAALAACTTFRRWRQLSWPLVSRQRASVGTVWCLDDTDIPSLVSPGPLQTPPTRCEAGEPEGIGQQLRSLPGLPVAASRWLVTTGHPAVQTRWKAVHGPWRQRKMEPSRWREKEEEGGWRTLSEWLWMWRRR